METKEKETELVQLIRQLKDYVILDKRDYEKLVQNSKPTECSESALEARDDTNNAVTETVSTTRRIYRLLGRISNEKCLEELKEGELKDGGDY